MNIWYSPYSLTPLFSFNARTSFPQVRQGFLIKVDFGDKGVGYADCHPWPELGDEKISVHLKSLMSNETTSLVNRSLELAEWDADCRQKKKSLFPSEPILSSHYTLPDWENFSLSLLEEITIQGYQILKLKVGPDLKSTGQFIRRLISVLPEEMILRLDFNLTGDQQELGPWLEGLGESVLSRLDFIEDPFPYEPNLWRNFSKKWQVSLALDQELNCDLDLSGAKVLVIKPARHSDKEIHECARLHSDKRWVFTHSMDHPVGRMMALAYAMNFYKKTNPKKIECGGFESRNFYQSTPFDDEIFVDSCNQLGTEGTGVGFNTTLEDCEWISCR